MNQTFLDILSLVAQVGVGFLPPGIGPRVSLAINDVLSGINKVQSELANEARLRGIPPEQLHAQLIAENDALMADSGAGSVAQHIRDRIAETQASIAPKPVAKVKQTKKPK